jgi:hypothetical protein
MTRSRWLATRRDDPGCGHHTHGYAVPVMKGALVPDATAMGHTADALRTAERSGDDVSLTWARVTHDIMLVRVHGGDPAAGMDLLAKGRQQPSRHADLLTVTMADIQTADCEAHTGDISAAIEIAEGSVGHLFAPHRGLSLRYFPNCGAGPFHSAADNAAATAGSTTADASTGTTTSPSTLAKAS